jgi:hypothetical protein
VPAFGRPSLSHRKRPEIAAYRRIQPETDCRPVIGFSAGRKVMKQTTTNSEIRWGTVDFLTELCSGRRPWLRSDADCNGDEGRPAVDVKQLAPVFIAYPPDTVSPASATDGARSKASKPVWVGPPREISRQRKATISCYALGDRQSPWRGERLAACGCRSPLNCTALAGPSDRPDLHKPAVEIPDPYPPEFQTKCSRQRCPGPG